MERAETGGFKKSLQPPNSFDRRLLQQNLPGGDMRQTLRLGAIALVHNDPHSSRTVQESLKMQARALIL
jgi:hypothetical protein